MAEAKHLFCAETLQTNTNSRMSIFANNIFLGRKGKTMLISSDGLCCEIIIVCKQLSQTEMCTKLMRGIFCRVNHNMCNKTYTALFAELRRSNSSRDSEFKSRNIYLMKKVHINKIQ